MRQKRITQETNSVEKAGSGATQGLIRQGIGFQLKQEQQHKPGQFIDAGGKRAGPIQEGPAVAHGVCGDFPVVANVKRKINQQQAVDRPLDPLAPGHCSAHLVAIHVKSGTRDLDRLLSPRSKSRWWRGRSARGRPERLF